MSLKVKFHKCDFIDDSHIANGLCKLLVPHYSGHEYAVRRHLTVFMVSTHNKTALSNVIEAHKRATETFKLLAGGIHKSYSICIYEDSERAQVAKSLLDEVYAQGFELGIIEADMKPIYIDTNLDKPQYIPKGGWDIDGDESWEYTIEKYHTLMCDARFRP